MTQNHTKKIFLTLSPQLMSTPVCNARTARESEIVFVIKNVIAQYKRKEFKWKTRNETEPT